MKPVVVIGGGPAGIAAACALAEQGAPVVLLERTPRLGGRAASFHYARMGEVIDDGQHVLLGACTATVDLLRRTGQEDAVSFQAAMRVPIVWPGGRSVLRSVRLPGPLHLLPGLLAYGALPPADRLAALRAGMSLWRGGPPGDVPFSTWLASHGQSQAAIAALWEPIISATLNAQCGEVSAAAAGIVFRTGVLRRGGARLGLFKRPLSRIFAAAGAAAVSRGAQVRLRSGARAVLLDGGGAVTGVELATGERIAARAVVATVPPRDLRRLLPGDLNERPPFSTLARIATAPILDLHLWFDRPVLAEPFVVGIRSAIQAVFDVTRIHGTSGPTHLVVSQSAARSWIDRPVDAVRDELIEALRTLVPQARRAELMDALVVRHPRATVLAAPGSDLLRPSTETGVRGLFLAGDWTATGWPSTIEGAIRSGRTAARAAL